MTSGIPAEILERYRVEREIGRGGNAVVYLAHDLKHDRLVALKLLLPESVEGVQKERFLREIQIAAKLSHPHILSLYDSGVAEGTIYYVMPFVEGESLRDRLVRESRLPIDTAVHIAREVADALACAHASGVVHRDIKPENILLQSGHAVVADFGVARGLAVPGNPKLTQVRAMVGTPAYMSPEQAVGANVDGRTDLYALGCVLYEMLLGHPPFSGATTQEILARHALDRVPAMRAGRDAVPDGLERIVLRLLAKQPEDRFATAAELSAALASPGATAAYALVREDAASSATSSRVPAANLWKSSRNRVGVVTGAALLFVALSAAGYAGMRAARVGPFRSLIASGALAARDRIVLADFRIVRGDTTLGPAITEGFRISLSSSPHIALLEPSGVVQVLRRMGRDPNRPLDPDLAREVAVRENAKAYLTGEVTQAGGRYVVAAKLMNATTGEVLAGYSRQAADSSEILNATEDVARWLRARIGESVSAIRSERRLEAVTTSSLEALRLYSLAKHAFNREGDYDRAIPLFTEALARDSSFATAWQWLAAAYGNSGAGADKVVHALTRAYELRDRLTERERLITTGNYHNSVTGDWDKAAAAFEAALEIWPDNAYSLNTLALIHISRREFPKAEQLLSRLITLDSLRSRVFYQNLFIVHLWQGRVADAEQTLDLLARRLGDNAGVDYARAQIALVQGAFPQAETHVRSGLERAGKNPAMRQQGYRWLRTIAVTRGRLADASRYAAEERNTAAARGNRMIGLQSELDAARLDDRVRQDPVRALRTLDQGLATHWNAIPVANRPYLRAAGFYASAGRPERGRQVLAEFQNSRVAQFGTDSPGGLNASLLSSASAAIALAENKAADALALFRKAADSDECPRCYDYEISLAYLQLGQRDSAIAHLEHNVSTRGPAGSLESDAMELAISYELLADLCAEKGDREKAARYAARFVNLWDGADPELQPRVRAKRELLQRLMPKG